MGETTIVNVGENFRDKDEWSTWDDGLTTNVNNGKKMCLSCLYIVCCMFVCEATSVFITTLKNIRGREREREGEPES